MLLVTALILYMVQVHDELLDGMAELNLPLTSTYLQRRYPMKVQHFSIKRILTEVPLADKRTKCIKRLFKCLATMTENFALSLSSRLFCSVTALNLSSPDGRGAVIAFRRAAPAWLSSSFSPGSSASFSTR
ncbi:hypothetical protein ANTPLA_LOCUS2473 [Anthophora plagiata]